MIAGWSPLSLAVALCSLNLEFPFKLGFFREGVSPSSLFCELLHSDTSDMLYFSKMFFGLLMAVAELYVGPLLEVPTVKEFLSSSVPQFVPQRK